MGGDCRVPGRAREGERVVKIWRERAGTVAPGRAWVGLHSSSDGLWIYVHDRLLGLLFVVVTEWKADKHRVG